MFADAVATYDVKRLAVEWDADALGALHADVARTRLFLLGETHGAAETPRALYALYRAGGFGALALEWEPAVRPVVDRFLAGRDLRVEPELRPSFHDDGRITAGHFALLAQLREDGLLDRLILFDDTPPTFDGSWEERDAAMAAALLRDRDDSVATLAVAGGFHAGRALHEGKWPMGAHVESTVPGYPEGRLTYCGGEIFNLGTKSLPGRAPRGPRFFRERDGTYVLELPQAHPAVVPALG